MSVISTMMVAMVMRRVMTLMAPMNVLVMTGTLEMDLLVKVSRCIDLSYEIFEYNFESVGIFYLRIVVILISKSRHILNSEMVDGSPLFTARLNRQLKI